MIIKSLSELQEADEATLVFGPLGLGGTMRPQDSAEFQQQVVARHELVPAVADGTRKSFERLRTIYAYGVLCYDIFTIVHDHALLVLEQALRDRFIDYHRGRAIEFVQPRTGRTEGIIAERYEQVHDFISGHRGWKLRMGDGPETIEFNGMLYGMREWARRTGLLRGQRNRGIEQAISNLRNMVAHPTSYTLTTPVDAAMTIGDLAEIINHLWGASTPGGRLYPTPIPRTVIALMWNREGTEVRTAVVADLPDEDATAEGIAELEVPEHDEWSYVLLRGVDHDWDLLHSFDAKYETTKMPSEWLWGPGSASEALTWLRQARPVGDEIDILDRLFVIRFHDGLLYLPRNPEIAAGVTDEEKPGVWYVIRADSPLPAFNHLRQSLAGGFACSLRGRCSQCPVETIGAGSWQEAIDMLARAGLKISARQVPDVRAPSNMGGIRCNRILQGTWNIPGQCR